MRFLLKTVVGRWEDVTEHIFKNRKYCLDDDGAGARYTDVFVMMDGVELTVGGKFSLNEFGLLCRFLGTAIPTTSLGERALVTPTSIRIHRGNSKVMHVLSTGENWKRAA